MVPPLAPTKQNIKLLKLIKKYKWEQNLKKFWKCNFLGLLPVSKLSYLWLLYKLH